MKKLVISLFTILSVIVTVLFFAFGSAQKKFAVAAEERYSRVLGENVVLYMDSSMTMPWFIKVKKRPITLASKGAKKSTTERRFPNRPWKLRKEVWSRGIRSKRRLRAA